MISEQGLKEPGKILGKNLWVMGPLKETTVEKIARKRDIAPVWRELDEVENLEIIERIENTKLLR